MAQGKRMSRWFLVETGALLIVENSRLSMSVIFSVFLSSHMNVFHLSPEASMFPKSLILWRGFSNKQQVFIQFSSVAQSDSLRPYEPQHARPPCPSPTPWVGDAIQPSHPLSSPSPPALNLSQHQGLSKWVSSSHQVAKVLEFQPESK